MTARIDIADDSLRVEILGWHKLWAFKSEIVVPVAHLESVAPGGEEARDWRSGLKLIGSRVPGLIKAGLFREDGQKVFWDVRDSARALVIRLRDEPYAKLIVDVEDPAATIAELESAMRHR